MNVGIDIRELHRSPMADSGRYLLSLLKYTATHPAGHQYFLYGAVDMSEKVHGPAFEVRTVSGLASFWIARGKGMRRVRSAESLRRTRLQLATSTTRS